ncbi:MAG: FAD-dependent oxidoreductase [Firmicutes bacterium]|nr:FAD-dependent oxidoreductase [Bacillota bacterium]
MSSKPDVVVLGAGIGGLTAAAWLAKAGRTVQVIERAVTVGGSAGFYNRRGRSWPTGATIAFGLEDGGPLRTLLDDLGVNVPARAIPHPMDVVLHDRVIRILADPAAQRAEFIRAFAPRGEAIAEAWDWLCEVADDVLAITATRIAMPPAPRDVAGLTRLALRRPSVALRAGLHSRRTVKDWLQRFGLQEDRAFIAFLNAQLVDSLQTDVNSAALLPASVALTVYRYGSFAIEGGLGRLTATLADTVSSFGSHVSLSDAVARCTYDKSTQVWTVTSRKGVIQAPYLLDATGTGLVDDGSGSNPQADPNATFWGALRLDAMYNGRLAQVDLPFAWQLIPSRDHAALFGDPDGAVYVTVHPTGRFGPSDQKGSGSANNEGLLPVTISVHTPSGPWLALSPDEYEDRKSAVTEALLSECARVLPDAASKLEDVWVGTPRTYATYLGKASVGGAPLTVARAVSHPIGAMTKHPRLFRAGENVWPGPGTLSGALSGYHAAQAILRATP